MTATDPLARERFRTILTDAITAGSNGIGRSGEWHFPEPGTLAGAMLPDLIDNAHFEYRTNEAGVRLRRVVVEGTWETDPVQNSTLGIRVCPACGLTGVRPAHLCTLV